MNTKLLALYGLKWHPFTTEVPTEAIHVPPVMALIASAKPLAQGVAESFALLVPGSWLRALKFSM